MKLSLNGLVGYLQGKGWKVKMNADDDEEEVFEIEEAEGKEKEEEEEEEAKKKVKANSIDDPTMISEEELLALKGLAQVLAKNGKLVEAISDGTLDTALNTVPAAAELVRNAQAQQKSEKDSLVAQIKANSANIYTDAELEAMTNPILVKLNAQMNVNYAGLGGVAVSQNAEQPLVIRPALLAPQAEEARNV
jgi:hypothetical protein